MNWQTVIDTIRNAVQENLETIILMLIVVGSMNTVNIVLGTIVGTFTESFKPKKFLFGILKAVIMGICIFAFCYTLNLFALTLQLTKDITISGEFITTIEVFGVLSIWAYDLSRDIYEKIKSLKNLKYASYDDVQINPQQEKGIG